MSPLRLTSCPYAFLLSIILQFGGGKSTGFGVIYDNKKSAMQFEPKYRLIRVRGNSSQSSRAFSSCSPKLDFKRCAVSVWISGISACGSLAMQHHWEAFVVLYLASAWRDGKSSLNHHHRSQALGQSSYTHNEGDTQ